MRDRKTPLFRLLDVLRGQPAPPRRRARQAVPSLDSLEGRVVLSHVSPRAHLAARLASATHVGPITSAAVTRAATTTTTTGTTTTGGCMGHGGAQDAQLQTDLQTLQTATSAIFSNSAVTDAQRQALGNDFRAISNAGVTVDRTKLQAVATTLLTDLVNNSYTANAQAIQDAFTAAFTGTSGAALTGDQTTLVNTAYNDFVTVATKLNVTGDELTALTNAQTAVQGDLTRLGLSTIDGHAPGQDATLSLILGGPAGPGGHGHRF